MEPTIRKWYILLRKIDSARFFDCMMFKEAFSKTFELLQPLSVQSVVPKNYMELVMAADCFARHFVTGISKEHDAAGELTGMMLWDCAIACSDKPADGFLDKETQKRISYTDVDSAIVALAEKYAVDYD